MFIGQVRFRSLSSMVQNLVKYGSDLIVFGRVISRHGKQIEDRLSTGRVQVENGLI